MIRETITSTRVTPNKVFTISIEEAVFLNYTT
jgi:hypothetical protein